MKNSKTNTYFISLSNAMCSAECLNVIMRIPVRVIDKDCICGGKVNAKASSTRRKEKCVCIRRWF